MFARNLHLQLKPTALRSSHGLSKRRSFSCFESRKAFRMKSHSSLRTERRLWESVCGMRKRTRRLMSVAPIQPCSKPSKRYLRELPRFKPTRWSIRPCTGSLPKSQFSRRVLSPYLWSATKNPADASDHGLVLVDPPAADERQQVATWMNEVRGSDTNFASAAA